MKLLEVIKYKRKCHYTSLSLMFNDDYICEYTVDGDVYEDTSMIIYMKIVWW